MDKPRVYRNFKEFLYIFAFFILVISLRISFKYQDYKEFIEKPFFYTYAKVINSYQKSKNNRQYTVIKLKTDNLIFYTSSYPHQNLNNQILRLQLFPDNNITFVGYLGTFYVKSRIKKKIKLEDTLIDDLTYMVEKQHKDENISSFYNAIFFATRLDANVRDSVSLLGISHLVALSGFHLGLLWLVVYFLLSILYKPLSQRYFPYRHMFVDLGFITLLILGYYLYLVAFPISLVRAYAMMIFLWLATILAIEIVSFYLLSTIIFILLALFISMSVSLSFWLSIAGVFYIFLLFRYTQKLNKWIINLIIIPIGIFILMLPIIHYIFSITTPYQLLSPPISLIFTIFYPFSIFLHIIGYGDLMDSLLVYSFEVDRIDNFIPFEYLVIYISLSIGAIKYELIFYILLGLSIVYGMYLFNPHLY